MLNYNQCHFRLEYTLNFKNKNTQYSKHIKKEQYYHQIVPLHQAYITRDNIQYKRKFSQIAQLGVVLVSLMHVPFLQ